MNESRSGQQYLETAPVGAVRVTITGAAGEIGSSLAAHLASRYQLRLLYNRSVPVIVADAVATARASGRPVTIAGGHEVAVADVTDFDQVMEAVRGTDAIVHLAAVPSVQAPWQAVLDANIQGCYTVYEGALRTGVPRVVFASSNHASGFYERDGIPTGPDLPPRPDGYYGVSKVFGEALGRFYAEGHGLAVICLRIGSFQPRPRNKRHLSTWLSHRDLAQLVWRSIETPVTYGVFYGISGNTRRYWDISSAMNVLGYTPDDDGEAYAADFDWCVPAG
jgi:uronate dehydrogenase